MLANPGQPVNVTTLENFFPGYFALVMATGIVSIGLHLWSYTQLAHIFLGINVLFYVLLWIILIARIIKYPIVVWNDLHHSARGVTFLTLVAGNNVLGSQVALITGRMDIAELLWILGFALWVLLIYTFFLVNIMKEPKPSLEQSINGAWLLIVVSTESVAVLGAIIANSSHLHWLIWFVSLCTYMTGGMFYFVLIGLILYRWLFFSMKAETLTPPYWINMGAVAIITLAGARLVMYANAHPMLTDWGGFIRAFTMFFWAFATWWNPLLFIMFFYRHFIAGVPLKYDPQYWSMVFPLGMYGVCTFAYASVTNFSFLKPISALFVIIALGTWVIVMIGLFIDFFQQRKAKYAALAK
ncbi:tellurite resistance/C4-dicarboxylate transporter family protein [Chitinophaga sp. sic0106]|uniref:tellurite resistance/C4-dicarboxylate transporter family protein n=1 Tax=Chitinophaga sp. sic0106 TaxID=2854785 RepID=UPI001C483F32|nr:tellurite resistance/C4-dicarboxylate transporter family protein [Chitinophaga sp. sic0106]MBV7531086.1 tellurite resistance/C4-dicarboxylate transporter family protein [Chitinophaga sp. sic0106]